MKPQLSLMISLLMVVLTSCSSGNQQSDAVSGEASASARYDDLLAEHLNLFAPLPASAEEDSNRATAEKIALGQYLYYDTRLSKDGNNSCNSCHNLNTFGVDNLRTSPGDAGMNGDRNSPTTLNAALHTMQFWDGRAHDVEEQAGMPILNPVEMAIPSESFLIDRLRGIEEYQRMFSSAFPDDPAPITYDNLKRAIGSFERQLLTPSRFDAYLNGQHDALSLQEKRGMLSFSLIGCATCHNGVAVGGNSFQKFGVYKPYWESTGSERRDGGRFAVTGDSIDLYMFKTPSLRNIAHTAPYFHDGVQGDLSETVRIMAEIQLNYRMNKEEIENVVAFLGALSGDVPDAYKKNPVLVADAAP